MQAELKKLGAAPSVFKLYKLAARDNESAGLVLDGSISILETAYPSMQQDVVSNMAAVVKAYPASGTQTRLDAFAKAVAKAPSQTDAVSAPWHIENRATMSL